MSFQHNDPNFLVIRTQAFDGSISCAGLGSAYVLSSLKVYTKALVLGCTARVGSVSSSATNSLSIAKITPAGAITNMQAFSFATAVAGAVREMSLTAGFTVHSLGEAAAITGNASALHQVPVLSDVIWRYRILPDAIPISSSLG